MKRREQTPNEQDRGFLPPCAADLRGRGDGSESARKTEHKEKKKVHKADTKFWGANKSVHPTTLEDSDLEKLLDAFQKDWK